MLRKCKALHFFTTPYNSLQHFTIMYFYIVDPQKLNQKSFERVQNQLYSCLSEYRISGETSRVTSLRTVSQLVDIAFSRNVKTLVAVGTDETLQEMINAVKDRDITLGYIPIMESELSRILGLRDIETACKTIAARRVENLDLGMANKNWFFTKLSFGELETAGNRGLFGIFSSPNAPAFEIKFSADEKYNGTLQAAAGVILNARDNSGLQTRIANPADSILDVLLLPNLSGYQLWQNRKFIQSGILENIPGTSVLHLKKIEISSPAGMPLFAGGRALTKTPAVIEVLPKALKMIVGKDRTF